MDKPQRVARRAEQETARLHDGRVTPASGSGSGTKNDVRTPEWSIEVKSTGRLSYSLKRAELAMAEKHALADGRRMAFAVSYAGGPGSRPRRYIVTTEDDFLEREDELRRLRNFRYYGNEDL